MRRKTRFIQVVVPSRESIHTYQSLKNEIELLVSDINGRFTRGGWIPIHYLFRNLDREELMAYYRCADMALVTPLKDGMNLVAKEYCASKIDDRGGPHPQRVRRVRRPAAGRSSFDKPP